MKRNFTTEAALRSFVRTSLALAIAGVLLLAIVLAVGLWETWRWQRGDYKQPVVSDTAAFYVADEELVQLSEVHDLVTARLLESELGSGLGDTPEPELELESYRKPSELRLESAVPAAPARDLQAPEAPRATIGTTATTADTGADSALPFRQQAWWSRAQRTAESLPTGPRVVIVLDDLGLSELHWRTILEIPSPLTLSFLPSAPHLVEWAQTARRYGHEVLLHLPMEPKGTQDPGPNALRVADSHERRQMNLQRLLSDAVAMGAVGANNHMGSRATEDVALMNEVLTSLGERGLLFLDSRTTATSVAPTEALRLRVAFAERDIFLDHEPREESVRAQLLALEWIARRRGYAIAIGHPHRVTLSVLAEWATTLEARGLVLAPLSAVIAEAGGYLPRASRLR